MSKIDLEMEKYISWDKLIKNLDLKIEKRAILLKKQLKVDRNNFRVEKKITYV